MGPGVPPDGLPPPPLLLLAAHFLYQRKAECLFLNGTQRVRYLDRYFYDRQEFVRFDSDLGKYVAVTAFGEADADYWNGDKQIMQYQKAVREAGTPLSFPGIHWGFSSRVTVPPPSSF
uniref:MHC class II beta chain N-terminal domain-containing protein n=1 Tax=Pseudonaja textilis TaxID=8673 RepID=A0A670Z8Y9_PSETE